MRSLKQLLNEAANLIQENADELKHSHTTRDGAQAREHYLHEMDIALRLRIAAKHCREAA